MHMTTVPYKICKQIKWENFLKCSVMAASLLSDASDLESKIRSESESDIPVSSVNTEDLLT